MPEESRFTEEDIEDVVEPVREIARAIGRGIAASIRFSRATAEGSSMTGSDLDAFWEEVADQLCWFVKTREEGE